MINFDDFAKVEFKVGTVLEAEEIEGSDEPRQILSGIKSWYKPSQLKGKQFVFVTNLAPRQIMGLESQAMILATDTDKPIIIKPSGKVPSGAKLC